MRRTRPMTLAASLLLALAACAAAAGQETNEEAAQLLQRAYQQSRAAQTPGEFTDVLSTLLSAEAMELSDAQQQYVDQLTGWLLNKRGEALAEQAADAWDEGDDERSAQLDEQALADFQEAVARDGTNWQARHNRGVSFAILGEDDEALADFAAVIELNPEFPKVWFNRAEIYYDRGEYEEAVDDYTQAIELVPDDFHAVVARGHAQLALGQAEEALADYAAALELDPNNAVIVASQGDAFALLGDWNEAAVAFRKAVALDDELGYAYQRAAWFMATCPVESLRNPALAVQAAERAIDLDGGEEWRDYDALAAAYARQGKFEEAQQAIATAQEMAEDDQLPDLEARAALYAAGEPYTLPAP